MEYDGGTCLIGSRPFVLIAIADRSVGRVVTFAGFPTFKAFKLLLPGGVSNHGEDGEQ